MRPADEVPIEMIGRSANIDEPQEMPAEPRDRAAELAYWRARGITPAWATRAARLDDRQLVTRGELRAALALLRRRSS